MVDGGAVGQWDGRQWDGLRLPFYRSIVLLAYLGRGVLACLPNGVNSAIVGCPPQIRRTASTYRLVSR
jgi:hypothetical protein